MIYYEAMRLFKRNSDLKFFINIKTSFLLKKKIQIKKKSIKKKSNKKKNQIMLFFAY